MITGRLSVRDEKEPQIVLNRARPISDFADAEPVEAPAPLPKRSSGTLYLRLPTENGPLFHKIRAIINMFPGESGAVVYFEDTRQRRGTRCSLDSRMLDELVRVLGQANVVVK